MKRMIAVISIFCFFSMMLEAQIDTVKQEMVSMSNTVGKTINGKYTYFKKGESEPYSGVLYGKYSNGNYASIQEFKDGLGNGTWINYFENGNLKEVGTYQENKVAGPIKKYYPSGKLKAEGNYREWRIRIGSWTYYDEDGKILKQDNYGTKGDLRDVDSFYKRGEISESWYQSIISSF